MRSETIRGTSADANWRRIVSILLFLSAISSAVAQSRSYVGVVGGVATLSGDARSILQPPNVSASSLYDPKNGPIVNVFFGRDLWEYVSVQGNYVWNRNRIEMTSSASSNGELTAYDEMRTSSQHSFIADVLVYFRARKSRFRPYLAVGTGVVHFSSDEETILSSAGTPTIPPRRFSSTFMGLHVPVGIDVKMGKGWAFRYSFSETISKNPISAHLDPPAPHRLMNFQNLFGIVRRF